MNNPYDNLPEADEITRGNELVKLLKLRPVPRSHPDWGMNPPRYDTKWGTKTALGLFRTVAAVMNGQKS